MKPKKKITIEWLLIGMLMVLLFASIGNYSDDEPWTPVMDRAIQNIYVDEDHTRIEFVSSFYERQHELSNGDNSVHAVWSKDQSLDMSISDEFTIVIEDEVMELRVDSHGLVYSPAGSLFITQTKDKETVSFSFNNDLYVLDMKSRELRKVSSDEIGAYDKNKFIELLKSWAASPPEEDYYPTPLVWVSASAINEDGNYIVYESNRRGFEQNTPSYDLWLKNLETNEEEIAVQDALLMGWLDGETISYRKQNIAGTYHIPTGLSREVHVNDTLFGITHQYAMYATLESIVLVHLETHEEREVNLEGSTTVVMGTVSPDGEQAAVLFYQESHHSARIAVINLDEGDIDRILIPPRTGMIHFDSNGKIMLWSHEEETTWIEE